MANELLFAITDGDMTQMRAWDELEIHDFFAKLEAYKHHMARKRPKVDEKDLYTKVEK